MILFIHLAERDHIYTRYVNTNPSLENGVAEWRSWALRG
jgi:hypothetical protein